jgi:hypothetical protein
MKIQTFGLFFLDCMTMPLSSGNRFLPFPGFLKAILAILLIFPLLGGRPGVHQPELICMLSSNSGRTKAKTQSDEAGENTFFIFNNPKIIT